MTSGLIYAAIIAMWGAYFIPLWLRRHEERSESRSVERFSRAMRILSRRSSTPDQRYVVMPPRPAEKSRPEERQPAEQRPAEQRPAEQRPAEQRPAPGHRHQRPGARPGRPSAQAASLAVRRRRILAALVLATVLAAVLAPLTSVPWWAPAVLLAGIVANLVHLRLQTRSRLELSRSRDSFRRRTLSRLHRIDSAERIAATRHSLREERAEAEASHQAEQRATEDAARSRAEGWSPVPVPLPTYVTKPMAPPAGRTAQPAPGATVARGVLAGGSASGGEMPFDQWAVEPDGRHDLGAVIDRRRAVND